MWRGPDPAIVVTNRRYPLFADDMDREEATRTARELEQQGLVTRRRVYRTPGRIERRYAVYAARPRCSGNRGR